MYKSLFLILCAATGPWLSWGMADQPEGKADKRDRMAQEVAEQFMKALLTPGDIEAMMKTVDVPFFFLGRENVKDREQLKKGLEHILTEAPRPRRYQVMAIASFGSLPEKTFLDRDHKMLREILEKTDRIVLIRLPKQIIAVAVRVQDNKAKVVGIRRLFSALTLAHLAYEKDKSNRSTLQAREVAEKTAAQFLKSAKGKDLNKLVELTDVPFYEDGTEIIKDREKLKALLKSAWVAYANSPKLPSQVLGLIRFGEFGDPYGGERVRADQVVAKDDWLVFVGKDGKEGGILLVRVREGKGKIIGVIAG